MAAKKKFKVDLSDWCTWEYTGQDPPPWDWQICDTCGGTKRTDGYPVYVLPCDCKKEVKNEN